MKAWHFVGETLRDGRPIPKNGEWLVHDGPAVMCESGLHFSRHPFDALQYAPGPVLCRVEVKSVVLTGGDKGVARKRMIVKRRDITGQLRAFARSEALRIAHLWDCPLVVLEYLKTGDEQLRSAAWSAAESAAGSAAVSKERTRQRREFARIINKVFK